MFLVVGEERILGQEQLPASFTLVRLGAMLGDVMCLQLVSTEEAFLARFTKRRVFFPMLFHMIAEVLDPLGNVGALITLEFAISLMRGEMFFSLGFRLKHLKANSTRESLLLRMILLVSLQSATVLKFFVTMQTFVRPCELLRS